MCSSIGEFARSFGVRWSDLNLKANSWTIANASFHMFIPCVSSDFLGVVALYWWLWRRPLTSLLSVCAGFSPGIVTHRMLQAHTHTVSSPNFLNISNYHCVWCFIKSYCLAFALLHIPTILHFINISCLILLNSWQVFMGVKCHLPQRCHHHQVCCDI